MVLTSLDGGVIIQSQHFKLARLLQGQRPMYNVFRELNASQKDGFHAADNRKQKQMLEFIF